MCLRYLVLSYILCMVMCHWSKPLLLDIWLTSNATGIYLTPSGNILAFYSRMFSICFKTIKGGEVLKQDCLHQSGPIKDLSVTTTNDGIGIFVTFSAGRTFHGNQCTKEIRSGCMDVYYIESLDSGLTWTKTQKIQREDLNDAVNRILPQVLYIKETGRTFIFYIIPGENINSVYKVDRPRGSSLFSLESKVYNNPYAISNLKLEYINVWDTITIYVFMEISSWMAFMYSSSNGVRWSELKRFQYVEKPMEYVMTKPATEDNLLVAIMYNHVFGLYILDDEGSTISSFYKQLKMYPGQKPFVVPYPDDGLRYIIGARMEGKNQSTHIYNVGQQILTDIRIPSPIASSDKAVIIEDTMYRINVLHHVNRSLYLSTLSLPKDS